MSRNYVDENGNLIQIAGKGIGVAEWGTPIEDWLVGHTSQATAITADKDGVLIGFLDSTGSAVSVTIYENGKFITNVYTGYTHAFVIPIKKGFSYYWSSSNMSITTRTDNTFYPFKENNNLQMVREKYSTEETVIGEYLGKPLYRRVRKSLVNSTAKIWFNMLADDFNVEQIVNCHGSDKTLKAYFPAILAQQLNGYIQGYMENTALKTTTDITIEYTKTTD